MKKFVEIEGHILAVDAIVMIMPPGADGKTFVQLVNAKGRMFAETSVAQLRTFLHQDCIRLG